MAVILFCPDPAGTSTPTALATGDRHTCAVLDSGRVLCWGLNSNGQLGIATTADAHTPAPVNLGASTPLVHYARTNHLSVPPIEISAPLDSLHFAVEYRCTISEDFAAFHEILDSFAPIPARTLCPASQTLKKPESPFRLFQ